MLDVGCSFSPEEGNIEHPTLKWKEVLSKVVDGGP
jgi:hypothetical protein